MHDLEDNTVKIHDLNSNHKIFGFSKLNFGQEYQEQRAAQDSLQGRKGCKRNKRRYTDGNTYDDGDSEEDEDDEDSDGDTVAETRTLDHTDVGDGRGGNGTEYTKRTQSMGARKSASSMLIPEPFGARFLRDDMFVGCSWSGITFFIDQDFNTIQYDFDARVCAFGAGNKSW